VGAVPKIGEHALLTGKVIATVRAGAAVYPGCLARCAVQWPNLLRPNSPMAQEP